LGFALAGSVKFANADPNSYRCINSNSDLHTDPKAKPHIYSYSCSHRNANANSRRYAYTDADFAMHCS
jgi:hypothetical protein